MRFAWRQCWGPTSQLDLLSSSHFFPPLSVVRIVFSSVLCCVSILSPVSSSPACYNISVVTDNLSSLIARVKILITMSDQLHWLSSNKHHHHHHHLSPQLLLSARIICLGLHKGLLEGRLGELFCFTSISNQNYLEPRQLILQKYRIYKKIFTRFFPLQAFFIWRKHERKSGISLSPWDKYFIWKYNLI